jgi:hypothetical protein
MLLAIRDYTKISTMDGPQTRTEKKGRDKKGGKGGLIYSAKHVRLTEALATKPKVEGPKSTKPTSTR